MSAGLGRPAGGLGPAGLAPGWPGLAGPGWDGWPGRGAPRGAEPIPVAVELTGLVPGRGPGRGAPREPGLAPGPDRGPVGGGPPGPERASGGLGAGPGTPRVAAGDPAAADASSIGTLGTGACGRVTAGPSGAGLAATGPAGTGPAGTGPVTAGPVTAGLPVAVRSAAAAAAGPVAGGLLTCGLAPGPSAAGACGRAGPGRGALRPPFWPSTAAEPTAGPVTPAVSMTAAAGAPADSPAAGLGLRAWPFGAWAENASLSLRTTGASIVDDAERTNSPISWSLAITALLSTPNSFASSYTRTFATALPLVGPAHPDHRGRSGAARAPAGVSFWCSSPRSHRALITTDPAFPAVLPFPPQPRPLSPGGPAKAPSHCAARYSASLPAPSGPGRRSARGNARRRCASSKHSWRGCRYAPRPGDRA
jgi:hypothetical protein